MFLTFLFFSFLFYTKIYQWNVFRETSEGLNNTRGSRFILQKQQKVKYPVLPSTERLKVGPVNTKD